MPATDPQRRSRARTAALLRSRRRGALTGTRPRAQKAERSREGFALLMALIAITILAILVTDLHETTGQSFAAATAERDQLRAEFLAKSGINLTRMLIGQEKNMRQLLAGPYQMMLKRAPPQLPVWKFADALLAPFANYEGAKGDVAAIGVDIEKTEGLGNVHGTFEVRAAVENGKINVNDPRMQDQASGQAHISVGLYGLLGGYAPSPNKYDPLFSELDDKGRVSTRLDLNSSVIDWWDPDEQRVSFEPLLYLAASGGAEDTDFYTSQPEPYRIKNAPFDTLEELRLVRGMTDDVWATFVEPDAEDPSLSQISIYGSQRLNPNEADPSVLLSRVCSFVEVQQQPLCNGTDGMKFITILSTIRMMTNGGLPPFSRASDFLNFVMGKPDSLYSLLKSVLEPSSGGAGAGAGGGLLGGGAGGLLGGSKGGSPLFTPLNIPAEHIQKGIRSAFSTSGQVFTIDVTGHAGRSQRRIRAVINTDPKWTPPKPNAGKLPPLGVFAYYRLD